MTIGRSSRVRPATIYDVAEAAGVSHQTVSRLLRGFKGIRPETRARVETAIAELQYRPNPAARSLKNGRTHRIGALTHDLTEVGPSKTIDGDLGPHLPVRESERARSALTRAACEGIRPAFPEK